MNSAAQQAYPGDLAVREWELDTLYTRPDYRRRGLGRAMLLHIEALVSLYSLPSF